MNPPADITPLDTPYIVAYDQDDIDYPIIGLFKDATAVGFEPPMIGSPMPDTRYPDHVLIRFDAQNRQRVLFLYYKLPGPQVTDEQFDQKYGFLFSTKARLVKNPATGAVNVGDNGIIKTTEIKSVDVGMSTEIITEIKDPILTQVFYGLRKEDFPIVLDDIEIVGSESLDVVPTFFSPPVGALIARITRTFTNGAPTTQVNPVLFWPQNFFGTYEYKAKNTSRSLSRGYNTDESESEGTSESEETSTSQSTSQSNSTSSDTSTENSTSTNNYTNEGTSFNQSEYSSNSEGTNDDVRDSTRTSSGTSSGTDKSKRISHDVRKVVSDSESESTRDSKSHNTSISTDIDSRTGTSNSSSRSQSRDNTFDSSESFTENRVSSRTNDEEMPIIQTPSKNELRMTSSKGGSTGYRTNTDESTSSSDSNGNTTSNSDRVSDNTELSESKNTNKETQNSTSDATSEDSREDESQSTSNTVDHTESQSSSVQQDKGNRTNFSNETSSGVRTNENVGTSSGTRIAQNQSTNSGTSSSQSVSSRKGTSLSKSNTTSSSTNETTGLSLLRFQLPVCLRKNIVKSFVSIPKTEPEDLPWDSWIVVASNSEHWKSGIWVSEKIEVYLPSRPVL